MYTMQEEVTITFNAYPEKNKNGAGIIQWYVQNDYLDDFLSAFAKDKKGSMTFDNETGRYVIRFTKNEMWPADIKEQASDAAVYLQHLDDDGNYPIDGEIVDSIIRSINGVEFYEWKENSWGTLKFMLKDEYYDAL